MSYKYAVMNDTPSTYIPVLASPNQLNDIAGFANNGVPVGSPVIFQSPLVTIDDNTSLLLNGTNHFYFNESVMVGIRCQTSFTLECWFDPFNSGAAWTLIGHSSIGDGLTYNAITRTVSFSTSHASGGLATASYVLPIGDRSYYAVGVHSGRTNKLLLNGQLVAQVDLTTEQFNSGYSNSSTSAPLYVGKTLSGDSSAQVMIEHLAVYDYALNDERIAEKFVLGQTCEPVGVALARRGTAFWLMNDFGLVKDDNEFLTEAQWNEGLFVDVAIQDDSLLPRISNSTGLTVAGTWTYGTVFDQTITTADGSRIEWDGAGNPIVETSLNNGTTWTAAINGGEIPGVASGFVTTGKAFSIRIRFPAGETASVNSRIDRLLISTFVKRTPIGNDSGRVMNLVGTAVPSTYPIDIPSAASRMGTYLNGGRAVITKSPDGVATRTLEFNFKLNTPIGSDNVLVDVRESGTDTAVYIAGDSGGLSSTGGILYINGILQSSSFTPIAGAWYNAILVMNADNYKNVTIGARLDGTGSMNLQLGPVAVYPYSFTAAQALVADQSYFFRPRTSIIEPRWNATNIVDNQKYYQLNWSTGVG